MQWHLIIERYVFYVLTIAHVVVYSPTSHELTFILPVAIIVGVIALFSIMIIVLLLYGFISKPVLTYF